MTQIILSPPVVVLILILLYGSINYCLSFFETQAVKRVNQDGQQIEQSNIKPDYRHLYPYAFFFTIMQILILVLATASSGSFTLPLLYIAAGILSLLIIFRR